MTELYLNGYVAVMDKSTKIKVVFDNPYFTKSSTYTHDISLPMRNCAKNQKIFGHINRKDVSKKPQTLKAILIADNKVLLNGSAIIREVTEEKAQVQLVAGNAEMNFFLRAEKLYIDELNLGYPLASPILASYPNKMYWAEDQKPNWADWKNNYKGYVFFPVYNETAESIFNRFAASYINIDGVRKESFTYYGANMEYICPQPYLCTMIQWIIKAIGYDLVENQLTETVFRNLFIANATVVHTWKDVLPHWTVNEFFSNIEKTFGLITVVDEGSKKARLLFSHDYFDDSKPICLSKVIDTFNVKIETDETVDVSNGNIGYSMESPESMPYAKIDDEILDKVSVLKYDNMAALQTGYQGIGEWNRARKIWEAEGRQYIELDDNGVKELKEVNQFRDLIRNADKSELDVELKIVPAGMREIEVEVYAPGSIYDKNYMWSGTIQTISVQGGTYDTDQFIEPTIQSLINDGIPEIYKPDKLFIAFSDGEYKKIYNSKGESFSYPSPFVDGTINLGDKRNSYPLWSLRLCNDHKTQNLGSEIYDKVKRINTVVEETYRYISNQIYNPRSVFIIDNKRYASKSITIECTPSGIEKVQEGIMYELKEGN